MYKYIVLDNVFSEDWCTNMRATFGNTEERQIGFDRYARHDFIDKELAREIHGELKKRIDMSGTKISHRFYMNKYLPNSGYIGPHVDGHITNSSGQKSIFTVLIYLNTCHGGETMILPRKLKVRPEMGRVLLLSQDVLHAGLKANNTKYILRTDLMCDPVQIAINPLHLPE